MTILFMDGFDHITTYAGLVDKGWVQSGGLGLSSSYARFTDVSPSMGIDLAPYGGGEPYNYIMRSLKSNYEEVVIGGAFLATGTPSFSTSYRMSIMDGTTVQVAVCFNTDGSISAMRGSTTIGTSSPGVFTSGSWMYVELKSKISNTVGTVDLYINGVNVLSLSGIDTSQSGNEYANTVRFGVIYNLHTYLDDIYITDGEVLGPQRIITYMPTSDGTYSDFTPSSGSDHYAMVDQQDVTNVSEYNEADPGGSKDSYGVSVGSVSNITAVAWNLAGLKTDAGVRKIKHLCRSNSTDYLGDSVQVNSDVTVAQKIYETDPGDSGAWTTTKIGNAEFGLEVVSTTTTT